MKDNIDKVYVINLKRRHDRRRETQHRLRELDLGIEVGFVEAIDGRDITNQYLQDNGLGIYPWHIAHYTNNLEKYHWYSNYYFREMSFGEIGCSLSHNSIWQEILQEGITTALVLEDDVFFPLSAELTKDTLREKFSLLKEETVSWDFMYLGRMKIWNDKEQVCKGIVRPGYSWLSHSYVIKDSGAEKLVNTNFLSSLIPLDEYLPVMYNSHEREDLLEHFKAYEKLNALAIEPNLTEQRSVGYGSDIDGS